jgi:hypothetical protein
MRRRSRYLSLRNAFQTCPLDVFVYSKYICPTLLNLTWGPDCQHRRLEDIRRAGNAYVMRQKCNCN